MNSVDMRKLISRWWRQAVIFAVIGVFNASSLSQGQETAVPPAAGPAPQLPDTTVEGTPQPAAQPPEPPPENAPDDVPPAEADGPGLYAPLLIYPFGPALSSAGRETVIGSTQINQNVSQTIDNIFRYEPGITVNREAGRFGLTNFNIRGLSGNQILTTLDGIRQSDSLSTGGANPLSFGGLSLDPNLIKQVTVYRGPGSLIYGQGDIGGVVAFVTKDPIDFLNVYGNDYYAGFKQGWFQADTTWGETAFSALRTGRFEHMFAYTHRDGNQLANRGNFPANPQVFHEDYLLAKEVFRIDDRQFIRATAEYYQNEVGTTLLNTLLPGTTGTIIGVPTQNQAGLNVTTFAPAGLPFRPGVQNAIVASNYLQNTAQDYAERSRYSMDYEFKDEDASLIQFARVQFYYQKFYLNDSRNSLLRSGVASGYFFIPPVIPVPPNKAANFPAPGGVLVRATQDNYYANEMVGGNVWFESNFDMGDTTHHVEYGTNVVRQYVSRFTTGQLVRQDGNGSANQIIIGEPTPNTAFPNSVIERNSFFVKDYINMFDDNVIITPGVRVDNWNFNPNATSLFSNPTGVPINNRAEWNTQPVVQGTLRMTESWNWISQYARGYRPPPFESSAVGITNPAVGYQFLPNANLQSERSNNYETGLSYIGENVQWYGSAYYYDFQSYINQQFVQQVGNLSVFTFNNVRAHIYGLESGAQTLLYGFQDTDGIGSTPAGVYGIGNLTYIVGDNLSASTPLITIPPVRGVVGLRLQGRDNKWGAEAVTTLVGDRALVPARQPGDSALTQYFQPAGYGKLDLLWWFQATDHVKVNCGLFNVFDKKYYDFGSIQNVLALNTNSGLPTVDLQRYTAPGINFGTTVQVDF